LFACSSLLIVLGCTGFTLTIQFVTPDHAESTDTQQIPLADGVAVKILNELGSTRVTVDPSATQVTLEVTRIALADTQKEADDLLAEMTVTVTQPTGGNNTLRIEAERPEGATGDWGKFQANITNDEINIVSIVGSVVVAQYRLRITLPPGHAVDVTQEVGQIRAVALDAPSTLTAEAGSIHAIGCQGSLTARAEAGDVDVEAHQGSLDLAAEAGTLVMEVVALAAADVVEAVVEAGAIYLDLPREVNANLRALTEAGHISFHTWDFADTSDVIDTWGYVEATLGTGGATINLEAEAGHIRIDSL